MASAPLRAALPQIHRLFAEGSLAGLPDPQLLGRFVARGDELAFALLVARHGPMVLATCRAALRDPGEAEDTFQATFLLLARKAGSVRDGEALAGWLHRVARRVAARANAEAARRRSGERRAGLREPEDSTGDRAPDDLRALLHAEVDRLPARYRLPVVLHHLEGRPQAEVARQLRWSERTVRRRLVDARERLRVRLVRRGVALSAGALVAEMAREARAAVPEALAASTARGAAGLAAGGSIPAIVAGWVKAPAWGRLPAGVAVALTLSAVAWASALLVASGGDGLGDEAPPPPGAEAGSAPAEAPGRGIARDEATGTVSVLGRVVDPEGRPVARATVRVVRYKGLGGPDDPLPPATSGPDGRFAIAAPYPAGVGPSEAAFLVVAEAEGFGPGRAEFRARDDAAGPATVRLVADDLPIEGRLLDLEGRPVAGATLRASGLGRPAEGTLDAWLEGVKSGASGPWKGLERIPFERAWATGPDGRFRLGGIGRGRFVELTITGPGIAAATIFALTREGPDVLVPSRGPGDPPPMVYHGARFEQAVEPSKPIVGTVRDREDRRPLAGVRIRGRVYDASSFVATPGVEAVTDGHGRFELTGLPRADRYRLFVLPAAGQPYPNAVLTAEARTPAYEPVPFDVTLGRGVMIRGRLTDAATGRPAWGTVSYFASRDNPHLDDFPGVLGAISFEPKVETDREGRFEVVGLPGRGLLAARTPSDRYPRGDGARAIAGLDAANMTFPTAHGTCYAQFYHRVDEVTIAAGADRVARDLQLRPGRDLSVTVTDPDGAPISGVELRNLSEARFLDQEHLEAAIFVLKGLEPGRRRHLVFRHEGRRLAGARMLDGDEQGALTIRLEPWGVITGRLVDEDGRPRSAFVIETTSRNQDGSRGPSEGKLPVGDDGRFRVEGLVPGLRYGALAGDRSGRLYGFAFQDLRLGPGEVRDLGDVTVKPAVEE